MEFKNIDRLTAWLDENLAADCYDLDAVLDEIAKNYAQTGSTTYELGSWETRSGRPECYSYDLEEEFNEEDDSYEYTFIF